MVAFENEDLSIQMMKISFVSNLWSWSKCCIVDGPNSFFNFFVWVGKFFVSLFLLFLAYRCLLYTSCMLWACRWVPCFF